MSTDQWPVGGNVPENMGTVGIVALLILGAHVLLLLAARKGK